MRGKVGTATVQGREVEVHADTDGGWHLRFEDKYVGSGETLDKAKAKARTHFKKQEVKVSVPFLRAREVGYGDDKDWLIEAGVADQLRIGRNNEVLVEIDGKRDQLGSGYSVPVWKPDTPRDKLARYLELNAERNRLAKEQQQIEKDWQFDLRKAVRAAIEEASS